MPTISSRVSQNAINRPEDVAILQKSLSLLKNKKSAAYYTGLLDGRFGAITDAAIQAFQAENRITMEKAGEANPGGQTIRSVTQKLESSSGTNSADFYTGFEDAIVFVEQKGNLNIAVFDISPTNLPRNAAPIVDEQLGAVIGYQLQYQGFTTTFDLEGHQVSVEEQGLETPIISPIDLISFGGVLAVSVRKLLEIGFGRAISKTGAKSASGALSKSGLTTLQSKFRSAVGKELRFTKSTQKHMANQNRYVPVHILKLAIRNGKRAPDPKGTKGAFMYKIPMKRGTKSYTLEVVIREKDRTVLHFKYYQ